MKEDLVSLGIHHDGDVKSWVGVYVYMYVSRQVGGVDLYTGSPMSLSWSILAYHTFCFIHTCNTLSSRDCPIDGRVKPWALFGVSRDVTYQACNGILADGEPTS